MEFKTASSPHNHLRASVTTVMVRVLLGLVPGMIAWVYFFGSGLIFHLALALSTAYAAELALLAIRRKPLRIFLTDGSAAVTACLLILALPPTAPWWISVTGTLFAIVIAKQLYGGLGFNPFNPAMAGYAMLLVSFPREMTAWTAPVSLAAHNLSFTETANAIFFRMFPEGLAVDALTMATPLDTLKTQLALEKAVTAITQTSPLFGSMSGIGWEWINGAFLLGGLWLIYKRVVSWHIPGAMLASLGFISLIAHLIAPEQYVSPLFHLLSGATMLCAFFIATDPVTAPTTPVGRIVFGASIGLLVFVIRTYGGYPDAVAFAVLLMNMVTPTLDYYTQPRVYGHK